MEVQQFITLVLAEIVGNTVALSIGFLTIVYLIIFALRFFVQMTR